jgi:hypothetical protein
MSLFVIYRRNVNFKHTHKKIMACLCTDRDVLEDPMLPQTNIPYIVVLESTTAVLDYLIINRKLSMTHSLVTMKPYNSVHNINYYTTWYLWQSGVYVQVFYTTDIGKMFPFKSTLSSRELQYNWQSNEIQDARIRSFWRSTVVVP